MSKREELFNALKEKNLISLYHERVMFYDEGFGEIQFWNLEEISESVLCLKNKGVWVFFDRWEFSETPASKSLHVFNGELEAAEFKLPADKKIILNHNHFYVDEFAVQMSDVLDTNVAEKGDWAYCNYQQVVDLLKKNVSNLDNNKDIKHSCIDIANFAMMAYYLGKE